MGTERTDRYRELIAALIRHGNVAIRAQASILDVGDGIRLKH